MVKPQSAFFERHGSRGIAVLERLLAALRRHADAGASLDVKRGDIGSTMDGYADAYLARGRAAGRRRGDALALPRLRLARRRRSDRRGAPGAGVFVLARTSNPEGAAGAAGRVAAGRTRRAGDRRRGGGRATRGAAPLGDVGVVVGATADHGLDLAGAERPGARPRPRRAGRRARRTSRPASRGVRGHRAAGGVPVGAARPGRTPPRCAPPPRRCATSWPRRPPAWRRRRARPTRRAGRPARSSRRAARSGDGVSSTRARGVEMR